MEAMMAKHEYIHQTSVPMQHKEPQHSKGQRSSSIIRSTTAVVAARWRAGTKPWVRQPTRMPVAAAARTWDEVRAQTGLSRQWFESKFGVKGLTGIEYLTVGDFQTWHGSQTCLSHPSFTSSVKPLSGSRIGQSRAPCSSPEGRKTLRHHVCNGRGTGLDHIVNGNALLVRQPLLGGSPWAALLGSESALVAAIQRCQGSQHSLVAVTAKRGEGNGSGASGGFAGYGRFRGWLHIWDKSSAVALVLSQGMVSYAVRVPQGNKADAQGTLGQDNTVSAVLRGAGGKQGIGTIESGVHAKALHRLGQGR
eukprot:335252-Amphidinium_carterae.1